MAQPTETLVVTLPRQMKIEGRIYPMPGHCPICGKSAEADLASTPLWMEGDTANEGALVSPARWNVFCGACGFRGIVESDDSFEAPPEAAGAAVSAGSVA